jgi:hypothetical protein
VNSARLDLGCLPHHFLMVLLSRASFMLARLSVLLVVVTALMMAAGSAEARRRHQIDATPFSHAPCSVLDGRPCTPSFCSVLNRGPCIPEIDYPYGENLQLTIETAPPQDDKVKYARPDHDLDTIGDLFAELRSCWSPPPADSAAEGMQMTVRFSFKRDGGIIAAPRLTFATVGSSADTRTTYLKAINASLDACMPLKFTDGLGGALAGRPIAIRYVDNRDLEKPPGKP